MLSPQDQATLRAAQERGEYAEPPTWAEQEAIEAARQRYADKIAALRAADTRSWQERIDDAHRAYEENIPLPLQIGLAYGDPGNVLLGLPFKAGATAVNTLRVGALEKAIAGLDKADDSYRVVKTAIQAAKAEGLSSKEASRILRGAEELLAKDARLPGMAPVAGSAKLEEAMGIHAEDELHIPGHGKAEATAAGPKPGRAWVQRLPDLPESTEQYKVGGQWPPDRVATHEASITKILSSAKPVPPGQKPVAVMTMGAPGWGKTSTASKMFDLRNAAKIDVDNIRWDFDEYRRAIAGNAKNAALVVHEEASEVAKQALSRAIDSRMNIVYDAAGKTLESYTAIIDRLHDAGYEVRLIMPYVPDEVALPRLLARAEEDGRYVDKLVYNTYRDKVLQNFEPLARKVDHFYLLENSGDIARLVLRGGAGQPDVVLAPEFMAQFRRLANEAAEKEETVARTVGGGVHTADIGGAQRGRSKVKETPEEAVRSSQGRVLHRSRSPGLEPLLDQLTAATIATSARAARRSDESSSQADTPRIVLQYLRQQLSNLGYSSAMMDQLRLGEAAQVIAEGRTPKASGAESPSGQGSARARGAAPGGVRPGQPVAENQSNRQLGRRPIRPRGPLSISQQMARLYRGTVAGDGYTRGRDNDAWAMVPDNLKGGLEDYWRGTPLTRAQVQRLLPVYRRYVAKTAYPGDMVQWITAMLRNEHYPR